MTPIKDDPSTWVYLKPKLMGFVVHNFEKWQDAQFKCYLENLTKEQIVIAIDFVEKYYFKKQNEIQSQHWFN